MLADLAEPTEGVDEAHAMHAHALKFGGPQHDQPHQIVGQRNHEQLFVDAGDTFASQHVQV